jgi:N-acetylmuramoyl-L-alanine amidase
MRLIKKGCRGNDVADIQRRLSKLGYNLGLPGPDGVFENLTEKAVKMFQQDRGLLVDGIVGDDTWHELVEATYSTGDRDLYLREPFFRGDDVRQLQRWLNTLGINVGPIDGIFGPQTKRAVEEFQLSTGLPVDGIAGFTTLQAFRNLRSILETNTHMYFPLREEEDSSDSSISVFQNRKIVIDFGHGYPPDTGAIGPSGLKESEICEELGLRFGNLLELLGTKIFYTREKGEFINLSERVSFANKINADLFLSVHLNTSSNEKAEGTSTFYFATSDYYSPRGKKLAEFIHKELVEAIKRRDDRVHGRNFGVLRETRMVAVLLEPLFITNPEEESLLKKEDFLQKIAVAIFDGVKNFLHTSLLPH